MSYTRYEPAHHRLQRSGLAVPGANPSMFEKAANSGVDYVVLDLEDAVAPADKVQARKNIIAALNDIDWRGWARPSRCASTASTRTTCTAMSLTLWSKLGKISTPSCGWRIGGWNCRCPNFMQGLSGKPPRSEFRNHFRLFHHSLGTVFSLGFPIRTPMRDGC